MSTATVSVEIAALLGRLKETTEIRDSQGAVVGVFTPTGPASKTSESDLRQMFDLEKAKETLEREYHLGRPLQDILADFNAREAK